MGVKKNTIGYIKLPFDNINTAVRFKKLMSKPWMAKVKYHEKWRHYVFDFDKGFNPLRFCDDVALADHLSEATEKIKKDFDIRKIVKKCLKFHTWYFENTIPLGKKVSLKAVNLKAFNIVREAIGEKPLLKQQALNLNQKSFVIIVKLLTEVEKIKLVSSDFSILKKGKQMDISHIPKSLDRKVNYNYAEFYTRTKKHVRKILNQLSFVKDVRVVKQEGYKRVKVFFVNASRKEADTVTVRTNKKNANLRKKSKKKLS